MAYTRIEINWPVVHRITLGEAYKIVARVTREVEAEAKVRTLIGPYTTGFLSASIRRQITVRRGGKEVSGRVGSPLWYAQSVHDGARPHKIRPLMSGYPLKFFWRKVGRTVWFMSVSHPGQPGQFYLAGPLVSAAARHGLKVNIVRRNS